MLRRRRGEQLDHRPVVVVVGGAVLQQLFHLWFGDQYQRVVSFLSWARVFAASQPAAFRHSWMVPSRNHSSQVSHSPLSRRL